MTAYRKRPIDDWEPRDLYVGPHEPLSFWMAHALQIVLLVVLAIGLVAWLLWGGRG